MGVDALLEFEWSDDVLMGELLEHGVFVEQVLGLLGVGGHEFEDDSVGLLTISINTRSSATG